MANVGESGGPAVDTPEPKQTATPPSNFKGSSSSAPNNPSLVCFQRSSSLRLSQMNNSVNFSSLPCIFASPRVSSPKLSRYLARHHSWDLLDTDFSLENETVPYSENLLDWAGANETEQSDTESSGIDTSDILLLDSPIEMITADPNPVPSSDVHCQNEGELPNLHSNSRRRCLVFETTGSPPRHIGDIYPDFITKEESADKQLNPEKPKSGPSSSRSCLVSGIGLHLNSLVRFREDSNNAMVDYVEKEEAEEEKLGQTTPKKKRRRLENCEENDGCKRCSCKKSKCLKLYCECFAAGLYCIDSCFCQECFNKPIHEDMVVETRKKIEGRNPLAFAPKVVNVPESGDDSRHKSGCNCRKSNCLKKYCECYQSGVGCSNNCRCDGCKNPLGRKDGSEDKETRMLENGTILQNNEQDNQDSEFCPAPLGAVRLLSCDETETSEQTALAIKRPSGMSNLSVIPECSYNAEKRVGKENMMPEIVRVDYSPRRVMIISCSPNSKRVSSPYNGGGGGGAAPSSSRSRRKIVLQSSPSFPTPKP